MKASTATQILETLGPSCRDGGRRALLLEQSSLNGIDFVEFEVLPTSSGGQKFVLHVHFLLDLAPPADVAAVSADLAKLQIHGGTRIAGIKVVAAFADPSTPSNPKVLDVEVDQQGDFSPYLLSMGWSEKDGAWIYDLDGIDRAFSVAPINFRPGCPVDFDCAPEECPPGVLNEPALDYMARDYASFRQMLIDLVAQTNPNWTERNPADVGIALLELFAYEADHLSYFQDAVANEAYLDTARQRISAKRHARLVDYQMHDGRNAWTYVHFRVDATPGSVASGPIATGTKLLTRITSPLRFDHQLTGTVRPTEPPGTTLNPILAEEYVTDPALVQVRVFETAAELNVDALNNEQRIHTWGNDECCLPRGATTAHLYAIDRSSPTPTAVRPPLHKGDLLLFEEVLGPETGAAADADPAHRQVVRIERIEPDPGDPDPAAANRMHDGLFLAGLDPVTEELVPAPSGAPIAQTLPLLQVTWSRVDALTFPVCLSTKHSDDRVVANITVARGNIVLADHGRSVRETRDIAAGLSGKPTFRLPLLLEPLTMQAQAADDAKAPSSDFPPKRDATTLAADVRSAQPAVSLKATTVRGKTKWVAVPTLLDSRENDPHFVADVDDQGRGVLRFGDGEYGERFAGVTSVDVWYRLGNGRFGNVGAEALSHIIPDPKPANWPAIVQVRNPLPARDGEDAELIEEVRQYAPTAFRSPQLRAVTELDYKDAAMRIEGVAGAIASFRWTGSWYTVFVGIDPVDSGDVVTDDRGITTLDDSFKKHVIDALTRYRLAGYDLEIRSAHYIPLKIVLQICVAPGYFCGDIEHAVVEALGVGFSPGDELAFFNPARFTFGQAVYLSQIYAAIERVQGVESATITEFHPYGSDPAGELENGVIAMGAWEIARLENSRSDMENGVLLITSGGGS